MTLVDQKQGLRSLLFKLSLWGLCLAEFCCILLQCVATGSEDASRRHLNVTNACFGRHLECYSNVIHMAWECHFAFEMWHLASRIPHRLEFHQVASWAWFTTCRWSTYIQKCHVSVFSSSDHAHFRYRLRKVFRKSGSAGWDRHNIWPSFSSISKVFLLIKTNITF